MQSFFPISAAPEQTFAAGLSMGGYGALRLGLGCPDKFAAVAGLSSALDVVRRCREGSRPGSRIGRAELEAIFGRELAVEGTPADLWSLGRKLAETGAPRPRSISPAACRTACCRRAARFARTWTSSALPALITKRRAITSGASGTRKSGVFSIGSRSERRRLPFPQPMKLLHTLATFCSVLALTVAAHAEPLAVGAPAPAITAVDQDGKTGQLQGRLCERHDAGLLLPESRHARLHQAGLLAARRLVEPAEEGHPGARRLGR